MRLKTLTSVVVIGLSSAALAQTATHSRRHTGNSMAPMSNSMSGGMSGGMGNSTMDNAMVMPDNSADTAKM